eukprot:jgi/Picsp_1/4304/NSC_01812-R1_---NA---
MESDSLRFTLNDRELKVFKSCLTGLYKIGSNLMISADSSKVRISACNSNRSAFLSALFNKHFFSSFDFVGDELYSVISFKSILPALKSSKVHIASFSFIDSVNLLVISLSCENDMMKEYRIPATNEQNFSPYVDKNIPYVQFIAEPGSLMKVLSTFHAGVHIVAIKSNHGSASDSLIELRTYAVGEGTSTEVAFNLKDFNSIVNLSEALEKSLVVRFSTPGSPLIVTTHNDEQDTLTLELIIATLPEGTGTSSQCIPENQHAVELGNTEPEHQWGEERYLDTMRENGDVIASTPPGSPMEREFPSTMPGFISNRIE